ncbi:MarR family transcriptional regulator [Pseudoalteromonas rubra]|uniref:HTH marR-type domain-containing protein n=1 Tax=Pseudoalteromonas rubra TaxID=43658 RepID=A0A0F4QC74_9GAMM|nr:MarR family transcriptional regulator [Pseudoalteromonas rubra]KJZ04162.1 hypothetical protein TW77_23650 [Pseudoalteromonas rubra]
MSDLYISPQVQRTLKALTLMAGNEVEGIEPKQLAEALETSNADVTRILANLVKAGFAERLPKNDKRWRLSKALVQLSNTVDHNFTNALRELQQEAINYRVLG